MKLDNLYLNIGAMKAGTTWLYTALQTHPDVHFTEEKEIHYFAHASKTHPFHIGSNRRVERLRETIFEIMAGKESDSPISERLHWLGDYFTDPIGLEWYIRLFSQSGQKKYCADFSNLYSHLDRNDWNHIKSSTHNLKVTYIIRDPLKRLWSHMKFHAQATGKVKEFRNWTPEQHYQLAKKPFIWENVEYSKVIKILKDELTPNQYMIGLFEDIHDSPIQWLRQLEGFLNIGEHSYDPNSLKSKINPSNQIEMPEFYAELFINDLKEEACKIAELGVDTPSSWMGFNNA